MAHGRTMRTDAPERGLAAMRYDATEGLGYMTGIQALARLPLDQRRLDAAAGLDTAGFVSGYRGSPLGGLDQELWRLGDRLAAHRVTFQPGVNEDLAATAVWGSQHVGLFPGARHDGVFGMWYGKAPGLDRSSDALRHANAAGTSALGGVLAVVGDDPACKSSTLPSASEHALRDLGMPVLAPADVQDVLRFGLYGWALSRHAGCWAALIAPSDIMDSAMTVDVALPQRGFAQPPRAIAPHIRLADAPLEQESRLQHKLQLAADFAAANPIDRIVSAPVHARLVVATAGKTYADVYEALAKLGYAGPEALATDGIRLVKLGMTWPLDAEFATRFCARADAVLVVEPKRPFVEEQLKVLLFGKQAPPVFGKRGPDGAPLLPATGELDVPTIAEALATVLGDVPDRAYLGEIERRRPALAALDDAKQARKPLYCAGCPHNASTRVPAGSRAAAGIGCHYMAQWMDRDTHLPTHMGAEGVHWLGQAPFTDEKHIFVNLGDGTYFHSGILAIRAAVAAGVHVTYKVLANDAVAMTGGQPVDGKLSVADIVAQVLAEGVAAVRVVSDDPSRHHGAPYGTQPRQRLDAVQRELRATPGCTVLVYDQTCAAELRRRRKRGQAADPDVRVVINDAVCEGCGDCSAQSNCVAVAPLETEFGTKRAIDQSACNKDLACLAGFCPAFVTLRGARPRKASAAFADELPGQLPAPVPRGASADIVIAGVGGTGIVTASQLLGMAAHLDGRFVSTLDMTGLAQKGGAVLGHVRISPAGSPHPPTRIPAGSATLLIGADPVTAASRDALLLASESKTEAIVDTQVAPVAEFVLGKPYDADAKRLGERVARRVRAFTAVDASRATKALFGATTGANVFLLGHAVQTGAVPVSVAAMQRAIELNGVAVPQNLAAFHAGRAAAHDAALLPSAARHGRGEAMQPRKSRTLGERIAARRGYLVRYQNEALAARYEALVGRVQAVERQQGGASGALAEAAAEGYFRALAVKDEYEVARLHTERLGGDSTTSFYAKLAGMFEPGFEPTFHFAPPLLRRKGPDGRPAKVAFGRWCLPLLRALAGMRRLRGTPFDPLRFGPERRLDRALRRSFEADVDLVLSAVAPATLATAVELLASAAEVKGFGPVREASAHMYFVRRESLRERLQPPARTRQALAVVAPRAGSDAAYVAYGADAANAVAHFEVANECHPLRQEAP